MQHLLSNNYLQPELHQHICDKQNYLSNLLCDIGHDVFRKIDKVILHSGWEIRNVYDYKDWRSAVAPQKFRNYEKSR